MISINIPDAATSCLHSPMRKRLLTCIAPLLFCLTLLAPQTRAQDLDVDGNQAILGGDWFSDSNWEDPDGDNEAPQTGDGHDVHVAGNTVIVIAAGDAVADKGLIVGDTEGGIPGTGQLQIIGSGNLNVGEEFIISGESTNRVLIDTSGDIQVGDDFGVGTRAGIAGGGFIPFRSELTLRQGSVNAQQFIVGLGTVEMQGGSVDVSATGTAFAVNRLGIINQSGGRIRSTGGNGLVSGNFNLIGNAEIDLTGRLRLIDGGLLDLSGNVLVNLDDFTVGDLAAGGVSNSGTANIADNAEVNVFGDLVVGDRGATSVINQTGGTVTSGSLRIGEGANASFNQSGGEVEVDGQTLIGVNSTGTLNLSGDAVYRNDLALFALGVGVGRTGNLVMSGNAQLIADQVQIGNDGIADARLSGNARVTAGTTFIAALANGVESSEGLLELRENAEYRGSDVVVGNAGAGDLILAGSSLLAAEDVFVGRDDNSTGAIQVLDNARLEATGILALASNDAANSAILVVDEGEVTIGGNSLAGNVQGEATIRIGESGVGGSVTVAGDASFGGSRSTTELTIDSGEFQAKNVFFDGFDPDNTSNTLNLNEGLLRGIENIEFQRGIVGNIAGGILLAGNDLVLGNDPTNDLDAVVVTQTGGQVNVGNDFLLQEANRARYTLEDGEINVDRDAVLGSDDAAPGSFINGSFNVAGGEFKVGRNLVLDTIVVRIQGGEVDVTGNLQTASPDAAPDIRQSGGRLNVSGDYLLPDGNHDLSGGSVVANRAVIGSLINAASFGSLDISGNATFQTDELQVLAGVGNESSVNIEQGELRTNRFIVQATGDGQADVSIDGGRIVADRLTIRSADQGIASAFTLGAIDASIISIESTGDGDSQLFQLGGEIITSQIRQDGDFSSYVIAGGTLTPANGAELTIEGDLNLTAFGELILSGTELATITGSLNSFALDFGGEGALLVAAATEGEEPQGIINALAPGLAINPDLFIGGTGYVPLINVEDTSNLNSGDALDEILLLTSIQGARLDELDFLANLQTGTLNGPFFSLVSGENFGQAGTVGIAFANLTAVPEPATVTLILSMLVSLLAKHQQKIS